MRFQSDIKVIKTHVRALHLQYPLLFMGIGNQIKICHSNNINNTIHSQVIFEGFNINGIKSELEDENEVSKPCDLNLAIFGNRFLTIYKLHSLCGQDYSQVSLIETCRPLNCHDWIIDVKFESSSGLMLIVLSHNQVIIFDWKVNQAVINRVACPDCSHILYSAHILSHSKTQFVLAAGTVFKEIVIWSSFESQEHSLSSTNHSSTFLLQRLKGHDGVIFAIDFNASLNVLASASDDRSVRIWTNKSASNICGAINANSKKYWLEIDFELTHTLYSHESRIWKVRIVFARKDTPDERAMAISVGEDSAICMWDLDHGYLIQKEKVRNKSVSIWSFDMIIDKNESLIGFTGASDGSVNAFKWNVNVNVNLEQHVLCQTDSDMKDNLINTNMPMALLLNPNLITPKSALSIALIGEVNRINPLFYVSSNHGEINIVDRNNDEAIREKSNFEFAHKHIFTGYCAMNVNKLRDRIVLGSKSGHIALLEIENDIIKCVKLVKSLEGKVFSVCFASENRFISCGLKGRLKLYDLDCNLIRELILPASKHHWPTCSILLSHQNDDHLIIGDRCGNVFTYNLHSHLHATHSNPIPSPTQSFRNIHEHNGVTCIQAKPQSFLFYTCGRNGKIFEFSFRDGKSTLLRMFRMFSDMEWIGGIMFDDINGHLKYIFGFSGRNFLVWNENEARFVWNIECGGGHRVWDFDAGENFMHFAFVKNDQILTCTRLVSEHEFEKKHKTEYFHSKKVNCCSILRFNQVSESDCDKVCYIATGSEDNQIFISKLNTNENAKTFEVEMILCGHISNVACISSCGSAENSKPIYNECYLVSVGGRGQLIIWKFEKVNDSLLCQQMISHYLCTANHVQNKKPWKSDNFRAAQNALSRYTSVEIKYSFYDTTKMCDNYSIYASSSDPAIRLFLYSSSSNSLDHLLTIPFVNQCIFSLRCLLSFQVISGSSDGLLRMFSAKSTKSNHQINESSNSDAIIDEINVRLRELQLVWKSKSHESGVNAIDAFQIQQSDDCWLIASGGDDNALCLNLIQVESDSNIINSLKCLSLAFAHTSQITGIKIISSNQIVSSSIDQRINLWHYSLDLILPSLSISRMSSIISSISDITSLEIFKINNENMFTIICGEGIEMIKLNATKEGE